MRRAHALLDVTLRHSQRTIAVDTARLRRSSSLVLQSLGLSEYALSVWLTTDRTVRGKNRDYRGRDKNTDVLSFPFQVLTPPDTATPIAQRALPPEVHGVKDLGEILIAVPYVQRQAAELGTDLDDRLRTLMVHGVCHLLGYDHEVDADAEKMEAEEDRLLVMLDQEEKKSATEGNADDTHASQDGNR